MQIKKVFLHYVVTFRLPTLHNHQVSLTIKISYNQTLPQKWVKTGKKSFNDKVWSVKKE